MGKTDALLKEMGGNLAESIGVRSGSFRSFPAAPKPDIPTASPKDGYARNRAAGEMLLANIVPDPEQPRKEFDQGAIERLSESIKARGLLQPLRVRWNPQLGKHVILVGERRYRAALLAGLTSVPCIFVETELTAAEILEEQLVENLLREDLNPIEQATSFQRYMELVGCHAKDLASLLKVSPSTVTQTLMLLKLPEDVQEQVAAGDIPPGPASRSRSFGTTRPGRRWPSGWSPRSSPRTTRRRPSARRRAGRHRRAGVGGDLPTR